MLSLFSRSLDPIGTDLLRPLLRQLDGMLDAADAAPRDLREHVRTDFSPACETDETDDHYVVSFDVPGVARDDIQIEMVGDRLIVSGERRSTGSGDSRRAAFQRVFALPDGVAADDVIAECKDGVLRLAIRKPAAVKPTRIKVGDGTGTKAGFFKSLLADKRKETVEVKTGARDAPAAQAH